MGRLSRSVRIGCILAGQMSREPRTAKERQVIRYLTTGDGVRLAWADAGVGPPIVKAAH